MSSRFRYFALNFHASCLTVGVCRSLLIIVLGTYRGASVIMRSTFDWNRSSISRFEVETWNKTGTQSKTWRLT